MSKGVLAPLEQLKDWQIIRYGDSPETRASLAYWRERGWGVDDPNDVNVEIRVMAFRWEKSPL